MSIEESAALREARVKLGLSLRTLGTRLGVTASYIFDVENGRRTPSEDLLRHWRVTVWPEPWTSQMQDYAVMSALDRHPDGAALGEILRTTGGMSEANIKTTLARLARGQRVETIRVYRRKGAK